MTKLLILTGLTGFGLGGARTEELRLVRGAADRGCDVAMCSDVLSDELAGIRHFRLDYPPGEQAPAQVLAAITEFKPDLAHVVGGGVRFLEVCDRHLQHLPWLFTAHNVPPAERIFPRLHGTPRLHYALRNLLAKPNIWSWQKYLKKASYSAAICHSQTVARRLAAAGCPPDKIRQIPFGSELPPDAMAAQPNDAPVFHPDAYPKILTIAGLAHHKAQVDGVRMAARLLPDFPKLRYCLVGMTRDKTYRAFLEKTIQSLGLQSHVSILHSVPEPVKFAALREADLYVQPSHEEGFCIAFLEAAMFVPRLIGADTGAIAAMAEGVAGTKVVACGDAAALESAARTLLGMAVTPADVQHRRQSLQQRYSWDAYLDAHLDVYRAVLA